MSFRLASRLARREVRRRPGRTLLVALLVALPTLAFAGTFTVAKTNELDPAQKFQRDYGAADAYVFSAETEMEVRRALEPVYGKDIQLVANLYSTTAMRIADADVARRDRARIVALRTADPDNPMTAPLIEMKSGQGAKNADEVVVSESLAKLWNLKTGDIAKFDWPNITLKVVGVAKLRNDFNYVGFLVDLKSQLLSSTLNVNMGSEANYATWLVDTPKPASYFDFIPSESVMSDDGSYTLPSDATSRIWMNMEFPDGSTWSAAPNLKAQMPWKTVGVTLGFAVLSVLIAAAFATSARRQMVTLGQLSANGAPNAVLRTSLALQGLWSGIVGVVLALAVFCLFLGFGHGLTEVIAGRELAAWDVPIGDLLMVGMVAVFSATFAAYLPARSAARTSVLTALSGRRNDSKIPRRLFPAGIAALTSGTGLEFLTAVGARNDSTGSSANVYVFTGAIGSLLILAGICFLGPVIISLLGPVSTRTRGSFRLTTRSLARSRARSAAVITSIAAFVAIGLSASTAYVSSRDASYYDEFEMADNAVVIWGNSCPILRPVEGMDGVQTACVLADDNPEAIQQIEQILENPEVRPLRWGVFTPDAALGNLAESNLLIADPGAVTIADSNVIKFLKLSDGDQKRLDESGAMYLMSKSDDSRRFTNGFFSGLDSAYDRETQSMQVMLAIDGTKGVQIAAAVNLDAASNWPASSIVVTEAKAQELGLEVVTRGFIISQINPLSNYQHAELSIVDYFLMSNPNETANVGRYGFIQIARKPLNNLVSSDAIEAAIAGVLLVITLLITAIGLSLMAAESRDERDVLVSIGAPPRTLGRVAGQRAFVLSAFGIALAIPVSIIPSALIWHASHDGDAPPFVMPWLTLELMAMVPVVALLMARIVGALARKLRPVRMSTFAFD